MSQSDINAILDVMAICQETGGNVMEMLAEEFSFNLEILDYISDVLVG